jgi:hypothetical protein
MPYPEYFHEIARQVRNWGRWGADDQVGTINFITPEVARRAAECVKTGRRFSLALPLSERAGIQLGLMPGPINPTRAMVQINEAIFDDVELMCTSDDLVVMGLQSATHWDGLGHVSYGGVIYNGYPADTITAAGAAKCGITTSTRWSAEACCSTSRLRAAWNASTPAMR